MKLYKKILVFIIVLILFLSTFFWFNNSYAATITLQQVVEKLKACDFAKNYSSTHSSESESCAVSINLDENSFTIEISKTSAPLISTLEYMPAPIATSMVVYTYTLQNGILSTEITSTDEAEWAKQVFSCVAQLHGYEEESINSVLDTINTKNYTVENEGFEFKYPSTSNSMKGFLKISLEKINLIQSSDDIYITLDDLNDQDIFEKGSGTLQLTRGNITLYLSMNNNKVEVSIGEPLNLSKNSYLSLCSVLEKILGNNIVSAFKNSYSDFSIGNMQWIDFDIAVNPLKTEAEKDIFENDKMVRITFDKSKITENTFSKNSQPENPNGQSSNEQKPNDSSQNGQNASSQDESSQKTQEKTITKLPYAGLTYTFFIVMALVLISTIIILKLKLKKYDEI